MIITDRYKTWAACCAILFTVVTSCNTEGGRSFNLGFETVNDNRQPLGWDYFGDAAYSFVIDSSVHQRGRYSLCISGFDNLSDFLGCASFTIPAPVSGDTLVLSGYMKTENVTGSAILAIKVLGYEGQPIGSSVRSGEIRGTQEWRKYTIKAPYDFHNALKMMGGAILRGNGRIWIDDFQLTVTGRSVENLPLKKIAGNDRRNMDAERASIVLSKTLTASQIKLLANVGMVWGFLKYYHPAVIKGNYDWDRELFRMLPRVMNTSAPKEAYKTIEQWVDDLGSVPENKDRRNIPASEVKCQPDFGLLFSKNNLPKSLVKKLDFIRSNYREYPDDHYVSLSQIGNPVFPNEVHYNAGPYPDAALRLLALFRYWNAIQYFYPYRHLIKEDWDNVLCRFIPRFLKAEDKFDFERACLELIGCIHDGHANIWGQNPTLDTLKGMMIAPFKARFIEGKLVVLGNYKGSAEIDSELRRGDIIEDIDGIGVDSLIKKYLPLTPASNYVSQLNQLSSPYGFLLRSNRRNMEIKVKSRTDEHRILLKTIPYHSIQFQSVTGTLLHKEGFQLLKNDIGYIYPANLGAKDIDSIKVLFRNTKGIIVDLRCYPATFMPFVFGSWLKSSSSPFAFITSCSLAEPGAVIYEKRVSNGGAGVNLQRSSYHSSNRSHQLNPEKYYRGKLIILVDESTMSQAEYTAMALRSVPGSTVVGDTTAGADGDVSSIYLPGGIWTMISGLGIYYPDSSETQQVGVKVDVRIEPTIQALKNNRDVELDKAIDIIESTR